MSRLTMFEQQTSESNLTAPTASKNPNSQAQALGLDLKTQVLNEANLPNEALSANAVLAASTNKPCALEATKQSSADNAKDESEIYLRYFVRQIKTLCRLRSISYSELARDSGVSRSYLNDILAEKANPNLKIMTQIAEYFALPLSYMLNAPKKSHLGLEPGQRRYLIAMTENEWLTTQNARLSRINEEFSKKNGPLLEEE